MGALAVRAEPSALDQARAHLNDVVAAIDHLRARLSRCPEHMGMAHSLAFLLRMEEAWHDKHALSVSVAASNDDTLDQWFVRWSMCWLAMRHEHDWRPKAAALCIDLPRVHSREIMSEKKPEALRGHERQIVLFIVLLLSTLALYATYRSARP